MSESQNTGAGGLSLFTYGERAIRTVDIDGRRWAVASDICGALEIGNTAMAVSRLDEADVSTADIRSGGQSRKVTVISEDGATDLVLDSRKPEARKFRRFLTHEVWPAVRDHGGYLTEQKIEEVLTDPDTIIRLATDLKNERSLRIALEEQREIDRPAIEYVNTHVVAGDDVMLVEDWGRTYGLTKPQAFALLRDEKNLIYAKTFERWSRTKGCKVTETEYRPRAGKPSFTWFDVKEQRDAPRRNNGQARKTLYIKAVHAVDLARLVGLLPNLEAAS
ncbi:BRO family protein [Mycolicibacterium fortuitum]|uniref:BRO family protein n=1 Tax=Mycolicibacterium fortuitum TaxID=1766 RepID=UPI003AAC3FF7